MSGSFCQVTTKQHTLASSACEILNSMSTPNLITPTRLTQYRCAHCLLPIEKAHGAKRICERPILHKRSHESQPQRPWSQPALCRYGALPGRQDHVHWYRCNTSAGRKTHQRSSKHSWRRCQHARPVHPMVW